ncbi:MAG: hypothetical protein ACRD1K_19205 [Acidimicrobiales bacterium]
MERQLRFQECEEAASRSATQPDAKWRLDEETRRRGRAGVAAARGALARAATHRRPAA